MNYSQNNNLLIVGAGQYGLVALEIAQAMHRFDKIAFLDDSFKESSAFPVACHPEPFDKLRTGSANSGVEGSSLTIIGSTCDIEKFAGEFHYGFVAIGNPKARRRLTEALRYNCMTPAILVHPDAYVSPNAQLQKGCCIEPLATVQTGAVVATASFIASGAVIKHDAFVGEYCHVDSNAVVEESAIVPTETKICCNSVFCKEQGPSLVVNDFGGMFALC